jgi:hypothetical protein
MVFGNQRLMHSALSARGAVSSMQPLYRFQNLPTRSGGSPLSRGVMAGSRPPIGSVSALPAALPSNDASQREAGRSACLDSGHCGKARSPPVSSRARQETDLLCIAQWPHRHPPIHHQQPPLMNESSIWTMLAIQVDKTGLGRADRGVWATDGGGGELRIRQSGPAQPPSANIPGLC